MKKLMLFLAIFPVISNCYSQKTTKPVEKSGLTISIPIVNKVQYYDHYFEKNAYRTKYGGFSGGLYYRIGPDKVSMIGGVAIANYQPIYDLSKVGYYGPKTHNMDVLFFDAIYHKKLFNMANVLGGLNFSRYKYRYMPIDFSRDSVWSDKTLGPLLGAEFEPSRFLSASVIYRSSIISFDKKAPYHYISFDLRFNIPFYDRVQRAQIREINEARKAKFKTHRPKLPFTK